MTKDCKNFAFIINIDDFYNKYFPNLTTEQIAEFEAEITNSKDGVLLEELIKKYRPELTEVEQAELLGVIDREILQGGRNYG